MELKKLKRIGFLIALLCLALFVIGNFQDAQIHFLVFSTEIPIALALVLAALIGFVAGVFIAWRIEHKPKKDDHPVT